MARKQKRETIDLSHLLWVDVREAAPNKMFPEEQRRIIRFLLYNRAIPCAACGKKVKKMWTMLCDFKAVDFEGSFIVAKHYPGVFSPLTPVCSGHPLSPNLPQPKQKAPEVAHA